ncbi:hypothetical protein WR25_09790 [Diploscapter pachys]|uniref:Uncharacterized protein n=1 Tax=Diploscapter pachys TaxID=2018661 RepID=A0A2A2KG71_9BILA|nr:hypothetical protein WR25_09790 [Diploscapter pachys]
MSNRVIADGEQRESNIDRLESDSFLLSREMACRGRIQTDIDEMMKAIKRGSKRNREESGMEIEVIEETTEPLEIADIEIIEKKRTNAANNRYILDLINFYRFKDPVRNPRPIKPFSEEITETHTIPWHETLEKVKIWKHPKGIKQEEEEVTKQADEGQFNDFFESELFIEQNENTTSTVSANDYQPSVLELPDERNGDEDALAGWNYDNLHSLQGYDLNFLE